MYKVKEAIYIEAPIIRFSNCREIIKITHSSNSTTISLENLYDITSESFDSDRMALNMIANTAQ